MAAISSSLTGFLNHSAPDLKGNANSKNNATEKLNAELTYETMTFHPGCDLHIDIKQKTKEETDHKLKQLDILKRLVVARQI